MRATAVALMVLSSAPAWAQEAPSPKQPRLLVLPLVARVGVDAAQLSALSDYFSGQARRVPNYNVVTQEDVEQMLTAEMRNQLAGCDATSCLSDIAGALSADEILYGSVGRLGAKDLVLHISRVAPGNAVALGGEAERLVTDNRDAMFDAIPRLLKRLYPAYTPPPSRVQPLHWAVLAPLLGAIGIAFQYGALATLIASPVFGSFPPLYLAVLLSSGFICCSSPAWLSWLQAWLADLIGSRRVALWKPLVAGGLTMAISVAVGAVIQAIALGIAALGIGISLAGYALAYAQTRELPQVSDVAVALLPAMLVPGAALQFAFAGLVLSVPVAQSIAILVGSTVRSPDELAQFPRLFSPDDEVPAFLGWLPSWLVGGKQPERAALVEE